MAVAGLDGDSIILTCSYAQRDLVMQIPGSRWDKGAQLWRINLTWAAALQLRGLFGPDLQLTDELQEWAWHVKESRIDPAMELRDSLQLSDGDEASIVFHVKQWLDKIEEEQEN